MFKAKIYVSLKESILDPQGKALLEALHNLDFSSVSKAKIGKFITLDIKEKNKENAENAVKSMCSKLLYNPIIENYSYKLIEINKINNSLGK